MKINYEVVNKVLDCLLDYEKPVYETDSIEKIFDEIQKTFKDFNINLEKKKYEIENYFVRYYFYTADKKLLKKVHVFASDVKMRLACTSVRAYAISEKNYVCFEVTNPQRSSVGLKEMLSESVARESENGCYAVIGTSKGKPLNVNVCKMPNVLIAGSAGSGKSILTNEIILSLSARYSPKELKFLLIDPKGVELSAFEGLPHLIDNEIIVDAKKIVSAVEYLSNLMSERYSTLSLNSVDTIGKYNDKCKDSNLEVMPRIIVIIDEFADLMMANKKTFEKQICNLAIKGRAVGIHVILSTQRASNDVITKDVRACFPSRIALRLCNALGSRLLLDVEDAINLLGCGDLIYKDQANGKTVRALAGFVSTKEIKSAVLLLKERYE